VCGVRCFPFGSDRHVTQTSRPSMCTCLRTRGTHTRTYVSVCVWIAVCDKKKHTVLISSAFSPFILCLCWYGDIRLLVCSARRNERSARTLPAPFSAVISQTCMLCCLIFLFAHSVIIAPVLLPPSVPTPPRT
jgi:hypothetical protein